MQREAFKVKSGEEYDYLFPRALMTTQVKKENATVADTIKLIPQIVRETNWQGQKLAKLLKGKTLQETCRNIWDFVYNHIAYKKDENGKEQVRSLARTWNDRHNFLKDQSGNLLRDKNGEKIPGGVDCDCMTTFISTILSVLKITHALRIVKFGESHYQHIYPIVFLPERGHITLDCVVHQFNYEEPYSEKKDTAMDLEYLNGVYDSNANKNIDSLEMAGINDYNNTMSDLGKLFKRKSSGGDGGAPKKRGALKQVFKKGGLKQVIKSNGGIKKIGKKFLNITNKINPGTVPIRAGILAAMKVNFFKIPQRLKYAYMSDEEAQRRGVDMGKFNRLKQVKDKLENIFYTMGGKVENFKKAVLTGRGNKDKDVVAGLGYLPDHLLGIEAPISQLLGNEMFYDENIHEVKGLGEMGELGEVATAATITAATGILGAIAGLLKSIGSLFPKKSKESKDFENVDKEGADASDGNTNSDSTSTSDSTASDSTNTKSSSSDEDSGSNSASIRTVSKNSGGGNSSSSDSESSDSTSSNSDGGSNMSSLPTKTDQNLPNKKEGDGDNSEAIGDSAKETKTFWQKNKTWLLPTSVSAGVLSLSLLIYKFFHKSEEQGNSKSHSRGMALAGIPKSKKKKQKKKGGHTSKIKSKKKKTVAFV